MQYENIRVAAEKTFTDDIANLFNADVLQTIIRDSKVEDLENHYLAVLQGHSFKVTGDLAPRIHAICVEVCEKLQFTEDVEFFIESSAELNCSAIYRIDDDQPHLVVINSAMIDRFTDEELRFVLGHELGHLVSRNAELWRVVGFVFPPGTNMSPILEDKIDTWGKLSELSADRFGFLAAPDFDTCLAVFFKLSSGLDAERIAFDPSAYRASMEEVLEYFRAHAMTAATSHPVNPIRLKALELFGSSKLYEDLSAGREISEDEDLQKNMTDLAELIMSKGSSPLAEARKKIIATAGYMVASADGEVGKEELEHILMGLSSRTHFPRQVLDTILGEEDPAQVFVDAVEQVIGANPSERVPIFSYLIDVALADRRLRQEEVDLLYQVGENVFGLARKEAAQLIAEALQKDFVPNLLNDD